MHGPNASEDRCRVGTAHHARHTAVGSAHPTFLVKRSGGHPARSAEFFAAAALTIIAGWPVQNRVVGHAMFRRGATPAHLEAPRPAAHQLGGRPQGITDRRANIHHLGRIAMITRWVPAFIVRISLIAAALAAQPACQRALADELTGAAKDFVGRWQAAPDLVYEFTAAGKFRILRDPSKQPARETRWPLPPNTVSCTAEGDFMAMDTQGGQQPANLPAPGSNRRRSSGCPVENCRARRRSFLPAPPHHPDHRLFMSSRRRTRQSAR